MWRAERAAAQDTSARGLFVTMREAGIGREWLLASGLHASCVPIELCIAHVL